MSAVVYAALIRRATIGPDREPRTTADDTGLLSLQVPDGKRWMMTANGDLVSCSCRKMATTLEEHFDDTAPSIPGKRKVSVTDERRSSAFQIAHSHLPSSLASASQTVVVLRSRPLIISHTGTGRLFSSASLTMTTNTTTTTTTTTITTTTSFGDESISHGHLRKDPQTTFKKPFSETGYLSSFARARTTNSAA